MKIHILGICGTFMGGLAQILQESGHEVSGTDLQFYPPMSDQLNSMGITLISGLLRLEMVSLLRVPFGAAGPFTSVPIMEKTGSMPVRIFPVVASESGRWLLTISSFTPQSTVKACGV